MNILLKNLSYIILALLVIMGFFVLATNKAEIPEDSSLNVLAQQINEGLVEKVEIDGNEITATLKDTEAPKQTIYKERQADATEILKNLGVAEEKLQEVDLRVIVPSGAETAAANIIPIVLPVLLIGALIWFFMRGAMRGNNQAMSFGASKARMIDPKDEGKKTTFKDVAGNKEAKEELEEIVDFLKTPKRFEVLGAKIPKGVLLLGQPGTGKTLLAKAIAGEAGVPFFSISGSEFVEMFVGVGASRVRDLFKQAKKHSPAIVFIDEIDAVGRHRGAGMGGGNDEREQTLNQILVEMDGFESNVNIIVIAATNRPDVLDPALLRPGRFDRRVTVDLPDVTDRVSILKIHAKDKPLLEDVKLKRLAQRTPGFSGADLANLMNEGALLAGREKKEKVGMDHLVDAIEKVLLGPARKNKRMDKSETKIVAYHEGGHALVGASLENADPVHKVSIISRGGAGGYTLAVPEKDKTLHSQAYFHDEIAMLLGGLAAEELVFGETTTGPSNDISRATDMARKYVMRYGMSELGVRTFGKSSDNVFLGKSVQEERDYSEETAKEIDRVVARLVSDGHEMAKKILTEKRDILDKIADTLLEKETIEKDEFDAIVAGKEYVAPVIDNPTQKETDITKNDDTSAKEETQADEKKKDTPKK